MARRLTLIAWSGKQGSWIVEDDYDSELRYVGQHFPAMQGLDPERVISWGPSARCWPPCALDTSLPPNLWSKRSLGHVLS